MSPHPLFAKFIEASLLFGQQQAWSAQKEKQTSPTPKAPKKSTKKATK